MTRPPSQAVIEAVEWAMCRLVHGEDWTVPAALPDSSEPRHRVAACYSCQRNGLEVARAAEAAALRAAADECEANARDWYGTDIFRDVDSADLAAVRSAMQAQGKDIDNLSAWYFRRVLTTRADILRRMADELTDTKSRAGAGMSADVWIVRDRCNACGRGGDVDESLNITYNLTGMLKSAGFHGWKWCIGKTAREVGTHMLAVLDGMNTDPAKWRAMNPPNGWGDYDQCLQGRMRAWAEVAAASNNSGDQIGGWL